LGVQGLWARLADLDAPSYKPGVKGLIAAGFRSTEIYGCTLSGWRFIILGFNHQQPGYLAAIVILGFQQHWVAATGSTF
jgi:hypothetical protein